MSKIALSPSASGTGTFTLASPNSNTDRTLNLPDAGGTVVSDTATQTLTNKTLTTPNIDSAQFATVTGTAPLYAARAWVKFNGIGTVSINASGNVSSVTDNGTGDYTVNFTTAMPDANFDFNVTANARGDSGRFIFGYMDTILAAASFRFAAYGNPNGVVWGILPTDADNVCVTIFR